MKLYESIRETIIGKPKYDGHIHLFDHRGILKWKKPENIQTMVGFMDIIFANEDEYKTSEQVVGMYQNFFDTHTPKCNEVILATGLTAKQAIDVYLKFPDKIKGFGEFKCYDKFTDHNNNDTVVKLNYGNLEWVRPVFTFDLPLQLPIYIHYRMNTDKNIRELDELLTDFPTIPVILCHCGLKESGDIDLTYFALLNLMSKHPNLYVDITYTAIDYFIGNPNKLLSLPPDRIFTGSDINGKLKEYYGQKGIENEYKKFNKIFQYMPQSDTVIKKLFKL